ncbi:MAG: V-type ATP synthase subunit E [Limnochordia bacterium]|jgi:V/A-type H+-transporting ATPase subunit E
MSRVNKLQERILAEAEGKAAEIRQGAEAKAAQLKERATQEAEAAVAKIEARGHRQAEERSRRIITMTNLDIRREILGAKQTAIEEVFALAMEKLASLDEGKYMSFMEELLLQSVETGDEEIVVAEKDQERFSGNFLARVNEKLIQRGKKGQLRLAEETQPLLGGFILRGATVEVNNSFEALVAVQRDELEQMVAEVLFA